MQTPNLQEIDTIIGHVRGEKGQDGTSPTVTIENITGGHRVTIVDVEHPQGQSFDILNGEKGDPGEVTEEELEAALAPYRTASDQDAIDEAQDDRLDDLEQATTATTVGPVAIASFDASTANMPLKSLLVDIEPVQAGSGDPSPENIRPISGWTGCEVTRTGKNLLPFDSGKYQVGLIDSEGNETQNSSYMFLREYLPIFPDTVYTFSANKLTNSNLALSVAIYDSEKNFLNRVIAWGPANTTGRVSGAFTSPQDAAYCRPNIWNSALGEQYQLELGAATDYEPYKGNVYNVTFPTEAGTVYGGTLDVVTGELISTHRYLLLDDTLTYVAKSNNRFDINLDTPNAARTEDSSIRLKNAYCSFLQVGDGNLTGNTPGTSRVLVFNNVSDWYSGEISNAALRTYFKDMIDAGKPCVVCYELTTPITYQLTPTEVTTLLGQNNVWADTGDVTVTYGAYLETIKSYADRLGDSILSAIAPLEATYTASRAYAVDSYLFVGTKFYKVTQAIAEGGTITPGTNAVQTTVAEQLIALAAG